MRAFRWWVDVFSSGPRVVARYRVFKRHLSRTRSCERDCLLRKYCWSDTLLTIKMYSSQCDNQRQERSDSNLNYFHVYAFSYRKITHSILRLIVPNANSVCCDASTIVRSIMRFSSFYHLACVCCGSHVSDQATTTRWCNDCGSTQCHAANVRDYAHTRRHCNTQYGLDN